MMAFIMEIAVLYFIGLGLVLGIWWTFFTPHEDMPKRLCALCRRRAVGQFEYICPWCSKELTRDRF